MKKVLGLVSLILFLFGFMGDALAHRERGARRFGERDGYNNRRHNHGDRDWRRRHKHHHHHRDYYYGGGRYRRGWYNEPYYGWYAPGVVVRLDPFGWLLPQAPVVVKERVVVEVEKPTPPPVDYDQEDEGDSPSPVSEERLDQLRMRAARDFLEKTPMPYSQFDRMSREERTAYGGEWDRHMLLEGGKGPFFKRSWR
ncbi:MAG: hypothetical protein A3J54_04385 [Candidatus Ryanbacteria bacterium RIFCSPHIGHO2_02_FULL_45_13b]|uniref:Uncharacterized protein n=1 Tax=Candidatus Ryanbacteria bacterium RIFCSPHIGHO2_02_FULL_45_13b TaxID=1802117 RepID=A0A1G2G4B1_9BACT|nr:MAG: hypothetical protein A3J54_04385 [Candidatus Ryanbacteria bacterium RIFCSPHIGHO2_02_FULL_45_13b]